MNNSVSRPAKSKRLHAHEEKLKILKLISQNKLKQKPISVPTEKHRRPIKQERQPNYKYVCLTLALFVFSMILFCLYCLS